MEQNKRSKSVTGIRKHGNRYQWSVVIDGKRVWGSCETLAAAKQARSDAISDAGKGQFIQPSKMTLVEYWEKEYLPSAQRGLKPNTLRNYRELWRIRVEPFFGAAKLVSITPGKISTWLTHLETTGGKRGPLSSTSVQHAFVLVSTILNHAVSHGFLAQNPCAKLEHKPVREQSKDERDWWTVETIREFLSDPMVSGHRIFPMIVFLFDTGARRGELCGLRWSSVNLDAGTVTIERSRVRVTGQAVLEGSPKSRRGKPKTRTLSLSEPAVSTLRQWRKDQLQERLLVGGAWRGEDFVFTTPVTGPGATSGSPYSPEGVSRAWTRIRDRWINADPARKSLPRPSIHECRHSALSAAVAAGVHLSVVAARAGHAGTRMIDQVYGHVSPSADREAAARVAGILFEAACANDVPKTGFGQSI